MRQETKTIAVLGVIGTQGGSVATHFLALGWRKSGITRSTTSPEAICLAVKGIRLVTADVNNPSTLAAAFRDAHVIFSVTDFWAPFFESYALLSQISDRAAGENAPKIEVKRGKNIIDAIDAVLDGEDSVPERPVYSTLPDFTKLSGGKYTYAYRFDAKAVISEYLKSKSTLWEKSSLLNMGFYTSNIIKLGGKMRSIKIEDGKLIYRTPSPRAIHPFVVTADTGLFVELLVRSPPRQDLLGVTELTSYEQYMKVWSEYTGVPSEAIQMSVEEANEASPGGFGREAAESTASSAEFGWGKSLLLSANLDSPFKATNLEEYMQSENWKEFLNELRI